MRNANSELKRYGVIILESLPAEDVKTGTNIYYDLLRYKEYSDSSFFANLYRIHSRVDFQRIIEDIIHQMDDETLVSLHIEAHGSDRGLHLGSGEVLPWRTLHELLRPLNVAQLGLLSVVIATCYSFAFLWSIDISKRASFKTVVFTMRDMKVSEIERGFQSFYDRYFNPLDFPVALEALQKKVYDVEAQRSPFQSITAERVFDQVSDPNNNPNFKEVVMNQYARLIDRKPGLTPIMVENDIRELFRHIRTYGREFFLYKDLYQKS